MWHIHCFFSCSLSMWFSLLCQCFMMKIDCCIIIKISWNHIFGNSNSLQTLSDSSWFFCVSPCNNAYTILEQNTEGNQHLLFLLLSEIAYKILGSIFFPLLFFLSFFPFFLILFPMIVSSLALISAFHWPTVLWRFHAVTIFPVHEHRKLLKKLIVITLCIEA